jgi:hypothetical protein
MFTLYRNIRIRLFRKELLGQVKKIPVSHQTFFKMQMRRAVFFKFFILIKQPFFLTTELKLFNKNHYSTMYIYLKYSIILKKT